MSSDPIREHLEGLSRAELIDAAIRLDMRIHNITAMQLSEQWRRSGSRGEDETAIEGAMGNKRIRVTGVAAVIVVVGILVSAFTGYAMWTHTTQTTKEHSMIGESYSLLACIVALDPKERAELRKHYSVLELRLACPWVGTGGA